MFSHMLPGWHRRSSRKYEILPRPPSSPNLSPTSYHFFKPKHIYTPKNIRSQQEVEITLKDLLSSKPLEFHNTGITLLIDVKNA